MHSIYAAVLALPAIALLSIVLVPVQSANAAARGLRRLVTTLAALGALLSACFALALASGSMPPFHYSWKFGQNIPGLAFGVYYDGVTSLMLALVSLVGWVICKFSVRYLDGEEHQGRYFRWTAFTVGSVSLMVMSGNLLMFVAAWMTTSLGLHQLLLHYGERPAARQAAWTKFIVSRLGDVALLGALAIVYSEFKTFEFAELFAAISSGEYAVTPALHFASLLIVGGAVTKSAQVPFHTWLPQTLDTPTPVSALMHAGIVNAGGYLVIRMSPLLALAPETLTLLAIVGAGTALYAAVVMTTQTSVKASLAYSTVAQMGFMMLQCGLGAFAAAMLHIMAHSLYKAHAFLNSGNVMTERAATRGVPSVQAIVSWPALMLSGTAIVGFLGISMAAFTINPLSKPGGLLLGFVLWLALTNWIVQVLRSGVRQMLIRALAMSAVLCMAYVACYSGLDRFLSASLPPANTAVSPWFIVTIVVAGVGSMFALRATQLPGARSTAWHAWYVHASNGFYIDAWIRRLFGHLTSQ